MSIVSFACLLKRIPLVALSDSALRRVIVTVRVVAVRRSVADAVRVRCPAAASRPRRRRCARTSVAGARAHTVALSLPLTARSAQPIAAMGDYAAAMARNALRDADGSADQHARPLFGNPFRLLVRRRRASLAAALLTALLQVRRAPGDDNELALLDGVGVGAAQMVRPVALTRCRF